MSALESHLCGNNFLQQGAVGVQIRKKSWSVNAGESGLRVCVCVHCLIDSQAHGSTKISIHSLLNF